MLGAGAEVELAKAIVGLLYNVVARAVTGMPIIHCGAVSGCPRAPLP